MIVLCTCCNGLRSTVEDWKQLPTTVVVPLDRVIENYLRLMNEYEFYDSSLRLH